MPDISLTVPLKVIFLEMVVEILRIAVLLIHVVELCRWKSFFENPNRKYFTEIIAISRFLGHFEEILA